MIRLNVIDRSPHGMYPHGVFGRLELEDTVRCEKWDDGLLLVESSRVHRFNRAGEYVGTERTDDNGTSR